MNPEARAHLKQLLEGQRVLSLAVLIDGRPHIGLLPFAVLPDHSGVLVHVSSLAKHTQGLSPGETVSVLIHQSEEAVGDPLQIPRVTLDADVRELRRGRPEFEEGRARYLARFPQAGVTFGLGDFKLLKLRFLEGRYVEGFARAMDITADDLRLMSPPDAPGSEVQPAHVRGFWKVQED
jgi:heme iron utilization protein